MSWASCWWFEALGPEDNKQTSRINRTERKIQHFIFFHERFQFHAKRIFASSYTNIQHIWICQRSRIDFISKRSNRFLKIYRNDWHTIRSFLVFLFYIESTTNISPGNHDFFFYDCLIFSYATRANKGYIRPDDGLALIWLRFFFYCAVY